MLREVADVDASIHVSQSTRGRQFAHEDLQQGRLTRTVLSHLQEGIEFAPFGEELTIQMRESFCDPTQMFWKINGDSVVYLKQTSSS